MNWINFLHLYQPASTDDYNINKVSDYSYQRIIRSLLDNPKMKMTFNISGCLLNRWEEAGRSDLIENIR